MCSQDLSWLVGELRALTHDLDAGAAPSPLIVAIDQGGHASRAIAFDRQGVAIAESFAAISTFRTGSDRVEHDAIEVTESVRTALTDLYQALGAESHRVVAAGLATQRSSIACWDARTNQPLSPILSWQDRRNAAFVAKLQPHASEIRELTGLVLSPHYGASKLRWCLENVDAVAKAHAAKRLRLGPIAAWLLRSLLTERPNVVDAVNAARTQLLDIRERGWSPQLLKYFGVPAEALPRVVASRHAFGYVAFGDRSIPLLACTGDQSAMPFAHGRPDPHTLYLNIGTGAFLQRVTSALHAPQGLLASVLWTQEHDGATEVTYACEGTVNGAASAIDWVNDRIGIDAHRTAQALTRANVASLLPPIFVNGIAGVGSPYWRSQLESRFVGEGSEIACVTAVIESIAFLICKNVELMGHDTRQLLASGGLSASNYLCECVATLSGLPVERTSLQESTATGLAYLTAGQPPDWQPDAKLQTFAPAADAALAARYQQWQTLMSA